MKSNSDVACEYIRSRILNGEYPPGYPLITHELSKKIEVSRTPIRDALRQLEAEGLVTMTTGAAATVKSLGYQEYRELSELRCALEGSAAALAAQNRSANDLREIKYALEAMSRIVAQLELSPQAGELLSQHGREDARFHIAIITAAHNDMMKDEILRLHLINRVMVAAPFAGVNESRHDVPPQELRVQFAEIVASHEEIFGAISSGDSQAARSAMERHIQQIVDKRLNLLAQEEADRLAKQLSAREMAYLP